MATFKINYIFNMGRQGWSETWYWDGATSDQALNAAQAVAQRRGDLLANTAALEAIRVSDESIRGDSRLVAGSIAGTSKAADLDRDVAAVAWLSQASSSSLYRRQVWLRGIPDTYVYYAPTGKPGVAAAFLTLFDAWVASVIAQGFRIKGILKTTPLTVVTGAIKSPVVNAVLIRAPGHGLVAGDSVIIRGAKFSNSPCDLRNRCGDQVVNGVWTVVPIDQPTSGTPFPTSDWFQIPSPLNEGVVLSYIGGGTVQKRVTTYVPVDRVDLLRPGTRDTGRAFFVPRGRARTRPRCSP